MTVIIALLLFLIAPTLHAQQYQVGAGYTSVTGPTDNGTLLTIAKQFSSRVWATEKTFLLDSPGGVLVATAGPRYRPPLSAVLKPNAYFDSSKWYPFVDLNLGCVKDPTGRATFAYGVGVGLDYEISESVTLLVVEYDRIQSKFFPSGGVSVSNVNNISAGIKFVFGAPGPTVQAAPKKVRAPQGPRVG